MQPTLNKLSRCLLLALLAGVVSCAPEPPSLDAVELLPGLRLERPEGWVLQAQAAGGYELTKRAGRIRELDVVLYPVESHLPDDASVAGITREHGQRLAKLFESHVLSETEMQGLYKSFLEGYSFHAFEKLESGNRTWGIHTQIRKGRKIQFWATVFTTYEEHDVTVVAFYDADLEGRAIPLEDWLASLSMLRFTE